jgi:hypothetical protein
VACQSALQLGRLVRAGGFRERENSWEIEVSSCFFMFFFMAVAPVVASVVLTFLCLHGTCGCASCRDGNLT